MVVDVHVASEPMSIEEPGGQSEKATAETTCSREDEQPYEESHEESRQQPATTCEAPMECSENEEPLCSTGPVGTIGPSGKDSWLRCIHC